MVRSQVRASYLWAGMLQLLPTSRQSGAPSSAASRLRVDLPGGPSWPSRLAAVLLLREADGEPAHAQAPAHHLAHITGSRSGVLSAMLAPYA